MMFEIGLPNPATFNFHLVLKIFLENRGLCSLNPLKYQVYLNFQNFPFSKTFFNFLNNFLRVRLDAEHRTSYGNAIRAHHIDSPEIKYAGLAIYNAQVFKILTNNLNPLEMLGKTFKVY